MKHLNTISAEHRPAKAQDRVCGYLFTVDNTKCVDADDPIAGLLKAVPVG